MAGDTRQPDQTSSATTTSINKTNHQFPKSQVGKLWDAFGNPEQPINVLPGATYNPTRENPKDVTLSRSTKTMSIRDLTTFHKGPCARDSLLLGLGAGFGVGGVRGIVGGEKNPQLK
jgi:cytochrome c oxidase assembly protein subunit 20